MSFGAPGGTYVKGNKIVTVGNRPIVIPTYTVATLPTLTSADSGATVRVSDGADASDCTVGGGASLNTCLWNGSAYVSAGDGVGAGTASGTVATLDGTGDAGAAATHSRGDHKHAVTPAGIGAQATITFGAGSEAALGNAPDAAGGYASYSGLATSVPANESDPIVGAITGLVKADGGGNISAAAAGTDYQAAITFGANVLNALGVDIGSAGAPVLFDGALGTPSSGAVSPDFLTGDDVDNALLDHEIGGLELDISACNGHLTIASGTTVCVQDAFNQTADPVDGVDDSGDGYSVGSKWYNTTGDKIWEAIDVTAGASIWQDVSSSSATALDDIAVPDANASIDMSSFSLTLTSSIDGAPGVIISNTAADNASDTTLLSLKFNDANDDNSIWLDVVEDADGTPASIVKGYGRTLELTNVALSLQTGSSITGIGTVNVGGVILGDTTPDADGEIGYASNAYLLFANSEDLTLTAAANLWTFGSNTGVTDISYGAMNIFTTGVIKGRASYGADITGAVSHNTTDTHGVFYHFTAAATATLDAAADAGYGAQVCYRARDDAEAYVIDVDVAEKINLDGTALAAGTAITTSSVGSTVCLVSTTDTDGSGTDGWETWGNNGWASE